MKKRKQLYNIFASSAFILVCVVLIFIAIPNEIEVSGALGSSTVTNSRFFPYVVSIFICVIALMELTIALIKYIKLCKKENKEAATEERSSEHGKRYTSVLRVVLVGGLFALYVYLFKLVGFIISTAVVLPAVLFVMGSRKWYHYVIFYGVAAVTYVLFKFVLHVSI